MLQTESGGVEALSYLIVKELSHLVRGHLQTNLQKTFHYGDLKNQLFFFTNQYTGYDALFIDHFTNTRYTLEQEIQADELTWVIVADLGLMGRLDSEGYRRILKAVQGDLNKDIVNEANKKVSVTWSLKQKAPSELARNKLKDIT